MQRPKRGRGRVHQVADAVCRPDMGAARSAGCWQHLPTTEATGEGQAVLHRASRQASWHGRSQVRRNPTEEPVISAMLFAMPQAPNVVATIGEFFAAGGLLMWPILGC